MVFKEPAKSSSSSGEETFRRVFTVRHNRTKFVNVFVFTEDISIRYRGRVRALERVEPIPAIADVPLVPFLDQRRGGRCRESIAFVIGIHLPEPRIIEARAANKETASIFIQRREDKVREAVVKGTDGIMGR